MTNARVLDGNTKTPDDKRSENDTTHDNTVDDIDHEVSGNAFAGFHDTSAEGSAYDDVLNPTENNDDDSMGATGEAAKYNQLVRLMYAKLPQELLDKLVEWVFEIAFCPGFVFPRQKTYLINTTEWHGESYNVAKPELLSVNKTILARYQTPMWTENTFVIGVGEPSYTTDFLQQVPSEAHRHIQKVHITFTYKDLGFDWTAETLHDMDKILTEEYEQEEPHSETQDVWDEWYTFSKRRQLESLSTELENIWYDKFYDIHMLPLTELTLDFTDCAGPWSQWLGIDLAGSLVPFSQGVPTLLNVLGPDEESQDEVLRTILVRNGKTWFL
ncbi:MAG: hypothetical protein Q9172_000835 [Xanthocarpia lactea]